jgi:hypothetical protein
VDSTQYASSVPLTVAEADLQNAVPASVGVPLAARFDQSLVAMVTLTASGQISSATSYIVLQGSMDGTNWIDLAWVVSSMTSGNQTLLLSAGSTGALGVTQTRAAGTAPASNGQNQCPLPALLRFVGAATVKQSSSSSSSGPGKGTPGISASIQFRLVGLR